LAAGVIDRLQDENKQLKQSNAELARTIDQLTGAIYAHRMATLKSGRGESSVVFDDIDIDLYRVLAKAEEGD